MINHKIKTKFKAFDKVSYPFGKMAASIVVRAIINQLKNQVIYNYCRRYVQMGFRVKAVKIGDDFVVESVTAQTSLKEINANSKWYGVK